MRRTEKRIHGTDGDRAIGRMNRRTFLLKSSAATLAAGCAPVWSALAGPEGGTPQPHAAKLGWRVSVQHWVYRRFALFEALDQAAAVGLRCFEIRTILKAGPKWPGVNADENLPADARGELKAKLADLGMTVPSIYADFNGPPDQARRLFEFCRELGAEVIVSEPPAGSLDLIEKLCEEYRMRLAIHNHQRGKSAYWSPDIVLDHCRNRSERIGACCDIGQWARSDLDTVESLRKLKGRIVSFHLKDVLKKGDLNARNTVMGEGQADCASGLRELKALGYQGLVTVDFEHDTPALQDDMKRNVAFVETQAGQLAGG